MIKFQFQEFKYELGNKKWTEQKKQQTNREFWFRWKSSSDFIIELINTSLSLLKTDEPEISSKNYNWFIKEYKFISLKTITDES